MTKATTIKLQKTTFLLVLPALLFISCKVDTSGQFTYHEPEYVNDGFIVGTLNEAGIDQKLIGQAVNSISQGDFREVHSLLIFRNNKLVLEEYFQGHDYQWGAPYFLGRWVTWDRDTLHQLQSVSKSITSTCIGIAVHEGFIESVDQSIFDYLPEHQHLAVNGKENITIEHLLTMTSGLQWDEWHAHYGSEENDIINMWFSGEDPISYYLSKPLLTEPGTSFTYSGGGMNVLGEIIRNATNMGIDEFSGKYLFEPLGVDTFNWWSTYENGTIDAAGCITTTPRAMLKVGVLFMNKGVWNDKRIISEDWLLKSSIPYQNNRNIKVPGEDLGKTGYGYTWWTKEFSDHGRKISVFWANGWGGQKIVVIPDLNTVIVMTGGTFTSKVKEFKLLKKYIIPAIK